MILGSPGTRSSLALRVSQCVCAAATMVAIANTSGSSYSAFSFLFISSLLQLFCSLGLAVIDIITLWNQWDGLHQEYFLIRDFLVVDLVLAILTWASASASASVTILLDRDVHLCSALPNLPCGQYKLFVILAFMTWSFRAASTASLFCLFASLIW